MKKQIALLTLLFFAVTSCALYPEIPDEYKHSNKKEEVKKAAQKVPSRSIAKKKIVKTYPDANPKKLFNFTEREKKILAAAVYENFSEAQLNDAKEIRRYPDLTKYGNTVKLTANTFLGLLNKGEGEGDNLLQNVSLAAAQLKQNRKFRQAAPGLLVQSILYFTLEITPLKLLIWGSTFKWTALLKGRYFLSIQQMSRQFLKRRILQNTKFMKRIWPQKKDELSDKEELGERLILAWADTLSISSSSGFFVDEGTELIKARLFENLSMTNLDFTYVVDKRGDMDLKRTVLLALFLLEVEKFKEAYSLLEPVIATLLFLHNDDGSIQAGLDKDEVLKQDNLIVPLILRIYFLLGEEGDMTAANAFKRSVGYYLRGGYPKEHEAIYRLAWGRLWLAVVKSSDEKRYFGRLNHITNWFLQAMPSPRTFYKKEVNIFRWDPKQTRISDIEAFSFLVNAYRVLKKKNPPDLIEWPKREDVKLFFALRTFLNYQLEEPDILTRVPGLPTEGRDSKKVGFEGYDLIGGFYSVSEQKPADFPTQIWGVIALNEALKLWNLEQWRVLKESAEKAVY